MMSFYHSQLQLIHNCITTSRGLSQKARKKRMFCFTWNNIFFATLAPQATKARAHGLFFRTSQTAVCSCTFQVSFPNSASINTST